MMSISKASIVSKLRTYGLRFTRETYIMGTTLQEVIGSLKQVAIAPFRDLANFFHTKLTRSRQDAKCIYGVYFYVYEHQKRRYVAWTQSGDVYHVPENDFCTAVWKIATKIEEDKS